MIWTHEHNYSGTSLFSSEVFCSPEVLKELGEREVAYIIYSLRLFAKHHMGTQELQTLRNPSSDRGLVCYDNNGVHSIYENEKFLSYFLKDSSLEFMKMVERRFRGRELLSIIPLIDYENDTWFDILNPDKDDKSEIEMQAFYHELENNPHLQLVQENMKKVFEIYKRLNNIQIGDNENVEDEYMDPKRVEGIGISLESVIKEIDELHENGSLILIESIPPIFKISDTHRIVMVFEDELKTPVVF